MKHARLFYFGHTSATLQQFANCGEKYRYEQYAVSVNRTSIIFSSEPVQD